MPACYTVIRCLICRTSQRQGKEGTADQSDPFGARVSLGGDEGRWQSVVQGASAQVFDCTPLVVDTPPLSMTLFRRMCFASKPGLDVNTHPLSMTYFDDCWHPLPVVDGVFACQRQGGRCMCMCMFMCRIEICNRFLYWPTPYGWSTLHVSFNFLLSKIPASQFATVKHRYGIKIEDSYEALFINISFSKKEFLGRIQGS